MQSLAVTMTFLDLVLNTLPALMLYNHFRLLVLAVTLGARLWALYVVLAPKVRLLNIYRGLLVSANMAGKVLFFLQLVSAAIFFTLSLLHVLLLLGSNDCHRLWLRGLFTVSGVLCPLELVTFMTISAFVKFVQEESAHFPSAPPDEPGAKSGNEKDKSPAEDSLDTVNLSDNSRTQLLPA